jgi:hypothetical protein
MSIEPDAEGKSGFAVSPRRKASGVVMHLKNPDGDVFVGQNVQTSAEFTCPSSIPECTGTETGAAHYCVSERLKLADIWADTVTYATHVAEHVRARSGLAPGCGEVRGSLKGANQVRARSEHRDGGARKVPLNGEMPVEVVSGSGGVPIEVHTAFQSGG